MLITLIIGFAVPSLYENGGADEKALGEDLMKKRIMVVDDDPDVREVMQEILDSAGYATETFENGTGAMAHARERRPDLILLDLSIPGEDGYEICQRFTQSAETSDVPIFVISGHGNLSNKLHSFCCGARRFLTKPLDIDELLAAVDNAFSAKLPPVRAAC